MNNAYAKNITNDLTAGDVDFELKRKTAGSPGYWFFPTGFIINPSADDQVQLKTIVCELFSTPEKLTLILECGKIHNLPLKKVYKSGTTTQAITVLGDPI
jgi:hypothetical protein